MPPGSKKRKALKKKQQQQQEGTGAPSNNAGLNGHDEHGSQDERDSDGNLSSPGSQGNEESWTRDSSPSPLSGLRKVTVKEETELTGGQGAKGEDFIAVGRGTDHEENGVDKSLNSFPENFTHNTRKVASQEENGGSSVLEITPAVDSVKPLGSSVSKVVVSDKNEQVESSTNSDSIKQKSDEKEEKSGLNEEKEGNIPQSAAETNKEVKTLKESEAPESSEEKSVLLSGPPVVRTSWLSCCGLFDVMAGSER